MFRNDLAGIVFDDSKRMFHYFERAIRHKKDVMTTQRSPYNRFVELENDALFAMKNCNLRIRWLIFTEDMYQKVFGKKYYSNSDHFGFICNVDGQPQAFIINFFGMITDVTDQSTTKKCQWCGIYLDQNYKFSRCKTCHENGGPSDRIQSFPEQIIFPSSVEEQE